MQSGKYTTEEQRKIMVNFHNQRKSLSHISAIVNRPKSTIKGLIDRYGDTTSLANKQKRVAHLN